MARTYRNLWPQVVCWENLLLAYTRCRRRKRFKREAAAFHFQWEAELLRVQRELVAGEWRPGPYYNFSIHDPKPRLISAAPFRDRVVHHAIVNVLEPLYERRFIHDSYACRRGKGTHRVVDHHIKEHLRAPGYVRYADDLVLFADSKRELWQYRARLDESLGRLRLKLHRDKTMLRPSRHGLNFLGYRVFPDSRRLQQRTIARFNRTRRRLQRDFNRRTIGFDDVRRSLTAWLGHTAHANSAGIRRALWDRLRFRRDHSAPHPGGR